MSIDTSVGRVEGVRVSIDTSVQVSGQGSDHPLSTCCLASRWKEDMAFLRSFYVADDIWRFA